MYLCACLCLCECVCVCVSVCAYGGAPPRLYIHNQVLKTGYTSYAAFLFFHITLAITDSRAV